MANKKDQATLEKIVSLCKRRGFVYPSSEIYGGLANSWDYGPYGVELKNNIKQYFWKTFVQKREDIVGLDAAIIMNPKTWEASGHLKEFKDPLVECKKCHKRYRADDIGKDCPECKGELTEPRPFSGLMKTFLGSTEDKSAETYFRPETAQGIFVNFKNILDTTRRKLPFGVAQIGKAFRNEITPGNFIFRTREFEQMEIEYFFNPEKTNWEEKFDGWLEDFKKWMDEIGVDSKRLFFHNIKKEELAHYSKKTVDTEFDFPFGRKELFGLAYRTDFDLKNHNLKFRDPETQEEFIPHVIEPSLGVDRMALAVILSAFNEEKVGEETRLVMKFKNNLAPVKVAIFPLLRNRPELVNKARELYLELAKNYMCEFDDNGNIGKRYRRQDEIGTPYCLTVDFDSLEKGDATVRDRDTMEQTRVKIKDLNNFFRDKFSA
ncbi:glycine--tRNA ligase [Candidatus Falkowbacteria bacterium]|nr:glycine--tRNA ligase [Candidatus Falkowbacteria bacterium]